ncbi:hypothetical protein [Dyella sp. 2HG41-7]|uniref:hypothetical protein n=1 Tax=Dyella sp. 2HG41-7 TaxID=2883239 RepID=UPI001F37B3BA|nr:hypothetical protein [Dyella sp. 2HG41-7]
MPGFLIQQGAMVQCVHGGLAMPTVPNAAVMLSGMPSCLVPEPWSVIACPGVPAVPIPPCVTAMWTVGTVRVTSFGQPLVVQSGIAQCIPTGTPLLPPSATQVRVTAM